MPVLAVIAMAKLLDHSRILIVDDFAGFRQSIKMMLHRLGGHDIEQVNNGIQAIKLCSEDHFDLIFCDYNLGAGQDGQQILEELHKRSLMRRDALFLMVTAETTTAQVMGAIEYRPDAYLTKPFSGDQLERRLARLMAKKHALQPVYQAIQDVEIKKALALCDQVALDAPKYKFSCLRIKSELLEQRRQFAELMQLFQDVLQQQPILWAMMGIGRIHYLQGDITAALDHFQAIRKDYPRQVAVLDWIAHCQQKAGDDKQAQHTLLEAVEISPKSVSRQANLGEVAKSLNNYEVSHKAFARSIQEGLHSCMLKPQYFEQYFEVTADLVSSLSGRDKSVALSHVNSIYKELRKVYANEPSLLAGNLSAAADFYTHVGEHDKASSAVFTLARTINSEKCQLSAEQLSSIDRHLTELNTAESPVNVKGLDEINHRLEVFREKLKSEEVASSDSVDKKKLAKQINAEGMALAKQGVPLMALHKFHTAMKLEPENLNFVLNAAQIILEHEELNKNPELREEARYYLFETLSIDESDIRWKRYQKLMSRVMNG